MLNLKKVIASICVIALMLSTVAFAATYTDVAVDSAYYEAVETLSKLGIVTGYEDGSYKPEETVTRAEMAALIARIQGYDETAKANADTIFTDVPKAHWASGYVAQAANQGIINGYGDGTFGPEDAVTYEQAVKMIMATLGYTPYANFNGGYPTGYLTAATRYGVVDGVSNAVVGSGANRGTIAQLLNNAIDTALMVQSNWSTSGDVNYIVYDGSERVDGEYRTLMSEYLGVVKLKGIVVENSVIDIDGTKTIKTDKAATVVVDVTDNFNTDHKDFQSLTEYTFLAGESDADDFIGKAVVLYVMESAEEADEYEVVAIAEDAKKNETIAFNLDQFVKIENERVYYVENVGDEDAIYEAYEKGTGAAAPKVVYNGKGGVAFPSVVANDGLSVNGGSITLIDNDNVKGIDIIFVEVAATAVVDSVNEGTVVFKEAAEWDSKELSELEFEAIGDNTVIELTKDGEAFDYKELKEWDALSIIASNDNGKGYIRAEVVSNAIEGTITASSKSVTSLNDTAFSIDGKKYDVIAGFGTTNLEVGDAGTFYIDKYGKIAAFNEGSAATDASSYAYILKMVGKIDEMDEKELVFLLLTADGIKEVNGAAKIKVNYVGDKAVLEVADMVVDPDNAAATAATFFSGKDVAVGDVVKYTLNTKGEVNAITVAGHDDEKFDSVTVTPGEYTYNAEKGHLGKFIDADSTVFFIDGTKKSVVGTAADLADGTPYDVAAIYTDNKAIENNIVVINGGLDNIAPSTTAAIITDIATGLDAEGASILTISYVKDGEEVTGVTTIEDYDSTDVIGDLTIGDVVKVKLNAAGNIVKISTVIDFAEGGRVAGDNAFDDYVDGWAASEGLEELVGGPVTWAKKGYVSFKSASSAYGDSAWTAGTYYTPSKDLAMDNIHNLSKADTISVVEFKANGSVAVKNGSASSFKVFDALYEGEEDASVIYDADALADATTDEEIAAAVLATEDGELATIEAYTDHVFCRYYDGELVEVVIVKAPIDIRVK